MVVRLLGAINRHSERDRRAILADVATGLVLVTVMHHELHAINTAHLHDARLDQVGDVPSSLERETFIEGLGAGDRGVIPAKTQRRQIASLTLWMANGNLARRAARSRAQTQYVLIPMQMSTRAPA